VLHFAFYVTDGAL